MTGMSEFNFITLDTEKGKKASRKANKRQLGSSSDLRLDGISEKQREPRPPDAFTVGIHPVHCGVSDSNQAIEPCLIDIAWFVALGLRYCKELRIDERFNPHLMSLC